MNFIVRILVSTIAVIITSYLLPGVDVDSFFTAFVVALVLSFLNAVVKPIMIILTIPITILTLGIFLIVINALLILLADYLVNGFEVKSFSWALIFSGVLWLVTAILDGFRPKERE